MRMGMGPGISTTKKQSKKVLYTDFSEYETGVQPNDWTKRFDDLNNYLIEEDETLTGGKKLVMEYVVNSTGRRAISWDKADGLKNLKLECRVKITNTASQGFASNPWFMLRGSGASTSDVTGYFQGIRRGETSINKYLNGSFTNLSDGSPIPSAGVWYKVEAISKESNISLKIWEDDDSLITDISIIDSSISDPGWTGIFSFDYGSFELDWFKVTLL